MVRLRTLGGLAVDPAVLNYAAAHRRPLALLALLAVAGERGMTRDKLVAFLWPESDDERARNSLSKALSSLRHELAAEHLVLGSTELRLNPACITSDVQEFVRLLDDGEAKRAIALYAGPFLDGVFIRGAPEFDRWADQERTRLHRLRADALESLAAKATSIGDHDGAVRWWQMRSDADPLDARVTRSLMEALVAARDSAGAIRHFRAHEELLRKELEVAPEPALAAFARGLCAGNAVRAATTAPPPTRTTPESGRVLVEMTPKAQPFAVGWWVGIAALALGGAGFLATRFRVSDDAMAVGPVVMSIRAPDTLIMDAAISPDGKTVAYTAGTPGKIRLFVRSTQGGAASVMISDALPGNHRLPRWSADNTTIAFTGWSPDTRPSVYVLPREGGQPRVVGEGGVFAAWLPNGKELLYSLGDSSWIVPLAGGKRRPFPLGIGQQVAWSPDGRRVAFVRRVTGSYLGITGYGTYGSITASAIWIADADGRNARPLTDSTRLAAIPAWSPDGRSVLFVSDRDGVRDLYRQRIGPDGAPVGSPERVTVGAQLWSFTLSADGSRLAYSTLRFSRDIWMAPIANDETPFSAAHRVTHFGEPIGSFALSHDGRWIAFASYRDGVSHIYKIAFDGRTTVGAPIQLTRDSVSDVAPRWSPDDREIAFYRGTNLRRAHVFLVRVDGLGERRLTSDSTGTCCELDPEWSPDGKRLVYLSPVRPGNGLLMNAFLVTRLSDGSWSAPSRLNDARDTVAYELRWSPGGDQLASPCCLLSPNGGQQRRIVTRTQFDGRFARWVEWEPDGRALFFQSFDSSGVANYWRLPLPDGRPQRVLRLSDPTKPGPVTRFDVHDRNLFFLVAADEGDIFVVELKRR